MEWVETTGNSVEEATEVALAQLGVLESEAEVEVLEEPRQGMFGRVRGAARVKARIQPTAPPPKQEKRRRGKKTDGSKAKDSGGGSTDSAEQKPSSGESSKRTAGGRGNGRRDGGRRDGGRTENGRTDSRRNNREDREPMPEDEQRSAGEEFLNGYLEAMGYDAQVSSSLDEDGILLFEIDGEGLGLIMGPGLNTLDALQEVCRNSIQRQADGREYGKVVVDVAGTRADRSAALEEFVKTEADTVLDTGDDVVFEVMSRSDRKIVHDVVSELSGLETESVGEDPRRRVVLKRA